MRDVAVAVVAVAATVALAAGLEQHWSHFGWRPVM